MSEDILISAEVVINFSCRVIKKISSKCRQGAIQNTFFFADFGRHDHKLLRSWPNFFNSVQSMSIQ